MTSEVWPNVRVPVSLQLPSAGRRDAGVTEMGSFMIVVPDKVLHGSVARRECKQRPDVETFVVDGPKEALDLPVGLRRVGPQQVMRDPQGAAGLLKAGAALGMLGMAHRERERVVGQHGLNGIRQRGGDVLKKRRRGGTRRLGRDPPDR